MQIILLRLTLTLKGVHFDREEVPVIKTSPKAYITRLRNNGEHRVQIGELGQIQQPGADTPSLIILNVDCLPEAELEMRRQLKDSAIQALETLRNNSQTLLNHLQQTNW